MFFNKKFTGLVATFFALAQVGHASNSGEATFYETGLGNCGAFSKDSDFVVALATSEYAGGVHCYKHIEVTYQGKTIDVTVVDSCPGCGQHDLDLSPSAFQALAPLDAGRIPVTWYWA